MLKLELKNGYLFVLTNDGKLIGKVINSCDGGCVENPPTEEAGLFDRIYGGNGDIYHQHDNPPNPFFYKSWGEVFENPEILPVGTKNVFIDQSHNALFDYHAIPVK